MIIWFDRNMDMHVDKKSDANDSFTLANYVPSEHNVSEVLFKANVVVSGHMLLLTHTQVTNAARYLRDMPYQSGSSTMRRHFFKKYLSKIEDEIKNYLRGTKSYTGEIKLRFRVGKSTMDFFPNYVPITAADCKSRDGYYYATYVILEKKLQ